MRFQANKTNTKLGELEKQIEKLEADKRAADLANQNKILENLERQINEVATERDEERSLNHRRIQQLAKQDSIRFVQMIVAEKLQKSQDSLKFINTEKRLERVMESKIKSDSVIIHETLSIVKQQVSGGKENESLMGMQLGGGESGIMGSVIFILLIIALMVVTFLAANNKKPKTIYLKPKDTEKNKAKNKTTLVIAHRLSTIIRADKIFVLNQGKIADTGTHNELLKNSMIYKNLYSKQLSA